MFTAVVIVVVVVIVDFVAFVVEAVNGYARLTLGKFIDLT